MKILFVHEKCGYYGGVEQNIADAVVGLRDRGHLCYLAYGSITEQDVGPYQTLFNGSFPCHELGSQSRESTGLSFALLLERLAPDVLYFHKVADLGFCEGLLARWHTVRMVHDHDLCCPRRHKYFLVGGRVCRHKADWRCWFDGAFVERNTTSWTGFKWIGIVPRQREMRRNDRFHTLLVGSRFMKEELLQNGFLPDKVQILPPVVRPGKTIPSPLPEKPSILYVGQLIRGKGVDLLLHALSQISAPFRATIVGQGNARDQLKRLCQRLGLTARVQFQGWIKRQKLDRFYSAARVVAVPSRWPEPFGMIGLEAMHHGRPVVAFEVGGIPDWLQHEITGLLVPEQDTTLFARALERLLRDDELANRLGCQGYQQVHKHFSFDRYLDQLEFYLRGEQSQAKAFRA